MIFLVDFFFFCRQHFDGLKYFECVDNSILDISVYTHNQISRYFFVIFYNSAHKIELKTSITKM